MTDDTIPDGKCRSCIMYDQISADALSDVRVRVSVILSEHADVVSGHRLSHHADGKLDITYYLPNVNGIGSIAEVINGKIWEILKSINE